MVDTYPRVGPRAKPVPPPKPSPRPPTVKPPLPPHKPSVHSNHRAKGGVVISAKRKPLTCVDDMAQNPLYMYSSNAALTSVAGDGQGRKSHDGSVAVPQTPVGGLVPPERPPKKAHLRAAAGSGGISPDHELRRIEASAQELANLNQRPATKRKPPMPDPPQIALPPPSSPVSPRSVLARSATPELPPPPPPPAEECPVPDGPLPPPPPHVVLGETAPPLSPNSSTYHKDSYMLHRKLQHSPTGYKSNENLLAVESSLTPNAWEKHYNVRQNSAATLVYSSNEKTERTEKTEKTEKTENAEKASLPASKPTFISEVTIATLRPEKDELAAKEEPPKHTYRSLMSANAERFAYLKQVSEGRQFGGQGNKLSDPGPLKSLVELNRAAQHQRSHSDGDGAPAVSIQPPKPPAAPKVAPPPRPKRPEEVECDQLSKDLMNHLLPSDSRLHALLSVPDPGQTTASLRTEGLLEVTSDQAPQSPRSPPPPPTATPTVSTPPKSTSCAPLPATSAYFTTSEPRAKLLTRYHSNSVLSDSSNNSSASNKEIEPLDSELLIKKKEELVSRLARKLDVLRAEREAIQEEVEANEQLGRTVTSRVACLATPTETNKVFLHVAEVDKITALLLALAGRLARAQNALLSLPSEAEPQEKIVLEGKRDKLLEQLDEAKRLKENIDRRSRQVSNLLSKYLSEEEFADYTHFVTMKAKLVIDQREIDEKIKLGDEQLAALRETLHVRPRV